MESDPRHAHRRLRVAIVASHVVQYHAPLYRALAADPRIDLTVLFCSRSGAEAYWDEGFNQPVRWDLPLLEGFHHEFLTNISPRPHQARPFGLINPGVMRRVGSGAFDVVVVQGWMRCSDWLAILAGLARRVPVVIRGETHRVEAATRARTLIKRAVLTRLFARVDAALAIGSRNAAFYRAFGVPDSKIFLAPYSVDNDRLLEAATTCPAKADLKKATGIDPGSLVILFSGKLIDVKRPQDLLFVFEKVQNVFPVSLVYVGDGPLAESLREEVRRRGMEHVHFLGFRNQTELPRIYAMADVFVLPSVFEPWGLVVNEAMCFGLPVICSDGVGAVGDLVRDSENGFTFRAGDLEALAARLTFCLADEERRAQMGRRSLDIIRSWGIPETVMGVVTCLRQVTAAAKC